MAATASDRLSSLDYPTARRLLVAAGLVVLGALAAVMFVRRVDTVEVVATLLFIPVFLGFLFGGIYGGIIVGALAALTYVALRWPAVDAVGAGEFGALMATRAAAYLVFGIVGGWANHTLETSLTKLDLYDQIDDATGLYNARFLLQATDLEVARAGRYQTVFSVVVVDVPMAALSGLSRRRRHAVLRELGRQLQGSVRTVDRVVHGRDVDRHRFAAVLPETGEEGSRVFGARFADGLEAFLGVRGVDVSSLAWTAVTMPGDDAGLAALREDFVRIDRHEHPEPQKGADAAVDGSRPALP